MLKSEYLFFIVFSFLKTLKLPKKCLSTLKKIFNFFLL